ncbi:peripheral myelin protein 22-like [Paramormyrops kingsleyae]|uniref:peripheral myelin protein 22-like n=1 Tax=Paramormyrops kingsleyae TaxID=1676925 RepID=UPI000CD669AD|nr:peripheral myelin protein 22-like [Paramormyrops kingsleyae]XP_023677505.1 peripheral myelin protein 22-like [Paramormyrops kingsleyae]
MLLLLFGIVVLHLAALTVLFVSTVFSAWTVGDSSSSDLWTNCTSLNEGYHCVSTYSGEWMLAVQSLMVLSVSFCGIAFFIFFCQIFTLKKGGRFILTGIVHIIASLLVLSAAIIYTLMSPEWVPEGNSFGFAYFLAWVAFPLALFSGLLYLVLRKKE